jgi:DNA-binding CsgD family transcriptional regulator
VAAAVLQALAVAVPEAAAATRASLSGTDSNAIADAAVGVLRTASRTRPIALLLDDADVLADEDRTPVGMLAAAADGRFRVVVATATPWPELADLTGPPVRLPSWGQTETAAAMARRDGPVDPAIVEKVHRRTAGDQGAVLALLRAQPSNDHIATAVLDPATTSPLRELLGRDATHRRCAALLAALHNPRLPAIEPTLTDIGLPANVLRPATQHLLETGLLKSTSDGRLEFSVPLYGESLAATADQRELATVHRALATEMLAEHAQGQPVEYQRLAEHIVGAGADIGQQELVEFAERVVTSDPQRAHRWCAALLAAPPADQALAGRAAAVSARALYDLARFQEGAAAARRALDLLPERDALDARTTLINSLLRIGDYDDALDVATDDGETPRSVPDGLQKARILLLQEQFDTALDVLYRLRPANRMERIALVTGVRMLAAIGADGSAWLQAEERTDPELSPLTREQVDTVRQALAWGDLYTSERAIMPGTLPSPAARRRPPPSLARLSAAVGALQEGRWPDVLALAKENEEERAEQTYVDGLLPALAAEVLARRGQPAEAEAQLRSTTPEQPFGHLIGWATAGTLLARDDPKRAIEVLAATDRRCRMLGYLTGRELILARWVDACLAADDHQAAREVTQQLAELANRVNSRQAILHWLLSQLATDPDERTVKAALPLAEQYGDRLIIARIHLHEAELGDNEALRTANAEFRHLGAADWQRRAAELMTTRGMSTRVTETITEADRRLIELIASGATNSEAATALGVSEKAIEARLTRLYRRTGLRSRVALVREYAP